MDHLEIWSSKFASSLQHDFVQLNILFYDAKMLTLTRRNQAFDFNGGWKLGNGTVRWLTISCVFLIQLEKWNVAAGQLASKVLF